MNKFNDPNIDPCLIVYGEGKPLGDKPPRYTAGNSPERAEAFLAEADTTEKEIVAVLCDNMGLKQGQRSRLVRVLALLYWRGAFGDLCWEMICHHIRRARR